MKLPERIKTYIGTAEYELDTTGKSGSSVLLFQDKVLKVERESEETDREIHIMEWLKERRYMELNTKRLRLCPLGMNYLQTTCGYALDIENTRYMVHLPNETVEETEEFLKGIDVEWEKEQPSFYEFAILLNGVHIGAVSIYLEEDRRAGELGWILNKKYWGQGFTTEAAKAVTDFAVKQLGVKHFVAHCDSENIGSYKVMEKLGMHLTDSYWGRKNRSSNEDRKELKYEMTV